MTPEKIFGGPGSLGSFSFFDPKSLFLASECYAGSQDIRTTFGFVLRPLEVELGPFKGSGGDP